MNAYINYTEKNAQGSWWNQTLHFIWRSTTSNLWFRCSGLINAQAMGVNNLNNILKDMCEAGGIAPKTNQTKSDDTDNRSQKPPVNKQLQQPTRATGGKHFKHGCRARHGVDESWSFRCFAGCVSLSGQCTPFQQWSACSKLIDFASVWEPVANDVLRQSNYRTDY